MQNLEVQLLFCIDLDRFSYLFLIYKLLINDCLSHRVENMTLAGGTFRLMIRSSYLSVGDVKGRNSLHAQLWCIGGGGVLGVIGPVEVITGDSALASGHVASNDEVCAA